MKRYTLYTIVVLMLALTHISCNGWLNLEPENDLIREEFWKSKEEVESVIAGTYVGMAANAEKLFYWGELRGGTLVEGDAPLDGHLKIMNLEISETNDLARWGFMYGVINDANEVIKYAPAVVAKDPSLSVPKMKALQSEAYFMRALSYFYLVRVFGSVPYVTEPSDDDSKDYYIPQTDGVEILTKEVDLLKDIVAFAPVEFDKISYTKGRSTKSAIYALMADIYLWLEMPQQAIQACESIYELRKSTLVAGSLWFDIFKSGNSNETLFELKYNRSIGTFNPLIAPLLFNQGKRLSVNELFVSEFDLSDMRAEGSSFLKNGMRYEIWKQVGLDNDISNTNITQQRRVIGVSDDKEFIVYRHADILLMEAEAQAMEAGYDRARTLLSEVQLRATGQSTALDLPDDETAILRALLDERKKEFAFEGKRWFDVLRISKRNNFANKDIMQEIILSNTGSLDQARIEAVLRDNNSLYMPVHKDELRSNKALVQNPFYKY